MKRFFLLLAALSAGLVPAFAARIDTVAVYSPSMDKQIKTLVISPDNTDPATPRPVIYLLHGYGGNHLTWLDIKPELPAIADREGILFVCPDGANSWYMDSPACPSSRYETFVTDELIPCVDSRYSVIRDRCGRAVTGLSMGGFGAMTLAMKHKDLFGAAGSTSGGLDIRPFPRNWELNRLLGEQHEHPDLWEAFTPVNLIPRLEDGDLCIVIDCGYSDFFLEVNEAFHRKLLEHGIAHDFYLRPGSHDHDYWRTSIDYQILFFSRFFAGCK